MFDSGTTFKELIDELKNEVDIALEIPDATYITWLNSLQQLLYTEIIKEQKKTIVLATGKGTIDITSIDAENNGNGRCFEDIYAIYKGDGTQLIKSTVASGSIFPNTFYKDSNNLGYNITSVPSELTIVYIVKPELVNTSSYRVKNVMLPIEFIELAKSKLRGEAYKLANEDSLSAKWLNDYNILLETFKAWVASKASNLGL